MNTIILIPPSEGKTPGGNHKPLQKAPAQSQFIIDQFKSLNTNEWTKILGLKDVALKKAIIANQSILTSKTMPAIERYSGVVYSGINYPSLSKAEQDFFNNHVRIVSAVFGLVKPTDRIPDYKLKIDKLKSDKYWNPIHSKELENTFIIDLLPQAHKKALHYKEGMALEFCFMKDGKLKPAGHHGKLIKGKFIRWLCKQGSINAKVIMNFNNDGFKFRNNKFIKIIT